MSRGRPWPTSASSAALTAACCAALALAAGACTDSRVGAADTDAGPPMAPDAGPDDAGRPPPDAGRDGGPPPDAGSDAGAFDPGPLEAFLAELDLLWGAHLYDCVSPSFATWVWTRPVSPLVEAVERGTLAFDPAAAERCLADARAAGCLDFFDDARCDDALVGLVREGDPCHIDEVCGPDADCIFVEESCNGICTRLPGIDEPCAAPTWRCQDGLRCDVDRSVDPPLSLCRAYVEDGGACDTDWACESRVCQDGACVRPMLRGPGEPCERFYGASACDEGYFCSRDAVCELRMPVGAPCSRGGCVAGALCEDPGDGVKVCIAQAGPGDACGPAADGLPCIANHVCRNDACLPLRPEGHPCGPGCARDLACVDGVCGDPVPIGDRCRFVGDLRCANGSACSPVPLVAPWSGPSHVCREGC